MPGAFKEQETANSNWLPVRENKVPEPRPGSCSQVRHDFCMISAKALSDQSDCATLQGKSHLSIPFLGITRPQSQFL
jgi:hypothetical protein